MPLLNNAASPQIHRRRWGKPCRNAPGIRKTLGSSNNQRVSDLVAERIVDFFQSVQIHQNHAQCPGAAAPIPKILPHGAAVSLPGKLVHQGKAALFNQLTVVLLCSLMIPLRRYHFNEKEKKRQVSSKR